MREEEEGDEGEDVGGVGDVEQTGAGMVYMVMCCVVVCDNGMLY